MGSKVQAPDYGPIAAASQANSEMSQQFAEDQLAWSKEQYADTKATTDQIVNSALANSASQQKEATDAYNRYQAVYQPVEDKLVGQVNDWASPARTSQQMGQAEATAQQQGAQARTASQQQLESFGISPSSTRYAAMDVGNRTATGASAAAAGTNAANQVQQQQLGLESEAINIGRGYPGQVSNEFSGSTGAGSAANSAMNQTVQTGSNTMNSGFNTGMSNSNQALSTWGNTLTQGYQTALSASNQSSGIGGAFGAIAGSVIPAMLGVEKGGAVPVTSGYAMGSTVQPQPMPYSGSNGMPPPPPGGTPGGSIPTSASPTGGKAVDDAHIAATPGEFVVPLDGAQWLGEDKLQKMILTARKQKSQAQAKPTPTPMPPGPVGFASRPQPAVPMGA